MARPLRIEFPGALYHLTARGNARQDIYLDARDSWRFLDLLGEVCARYAWRCFAYCLMTNHYHLVVETAQPNLSAGMRQLNGRYSQAFNTRHQREGHLFQGRYKAILVEREAYLLEVCRYVVLNPVRAGLARAPQAWRWSSYRATLAGAGPAWLAAPEVLGLFAPEPKAAARAYGEFIAEGMGIAEGPGRGIGLWDRLEGQIYLGAADFVAAMRARARDSGDSGASGEIPRAQRQAPPRPLPAFARAHAERHEAMARAHLEGGYSQAEVARHFGVHYSTVSRAARRLLDGE
jgi:REP element-mobilizing transposase RayT